MIGCIVEVELCPPEAREAALQVLYQRIPDSLRPRLVAEVLHEASIGQVDLSGLWIAWDRSWRFVSEMPLGWRRTRGRIIGAFLTQTLAGRAAGVWAPEVVPSFRRATIAAELVRAALTDLRSRGFRIVQAVLDESASRQGASDLIRGGMPRVTELLYLERETKDPLLPRPGETPPPLEWCSFDPAHEIEFRALLQATYIASLDMPEVEGVRSLDDIIQGHQSTGRFVPHRWQLGRVPEEPESAAVLLLSDIPDRDVWEVVYLGLTPSARGRGLGRAAIARALDLAHVHASRLELAVDTRNHPATHLYNSAGFVPFDRRSVHLVVFPENAG
jgi:GNAT superfamily N-acetyltransferase